MKTNSENEEKIKIYITIEPLGIKIGWVFQKKEKIQSIIDFVFNQTEKLGIKYKLGRVNENKTGAILLSESILGDFLQNDDQVTVYSEEYGFLSNNLFGDNDNNSGKKIFYHKNISDLYKDLSFLNKKREKQKSQSKAIKEEINEEDTNEEKKEINTVDIYKNKSKSKSNNRNNFNNIKRNNNFNKKNNSKRRGEQNVNNKKDNSNQNNDKKGKNEKIEKNEDLKVESKNNEKEREVKKEEDKDKNQNSKEQEKRRTPSDESSVEEE